MLLHKFLPWWGCKKIQYSDGHTYGHQTSFFPIQRWSSRVTHFRKSSVQFSSVTQSCPTLCDPMNHSMPGLPVHHQLPEFSQIYVHRVGDAIQHLILCCPLLLLSPIPPSIRVFSNESTLLIIQFSHPVVLDTLRPHESWHARPPCPSPTPRVYSNTCPSSW